MDTPTIFLTGGHITPALAVARSIDTQTNHRVHIVFIGRTHAFDTVHLESEETKLVRAAGYTFESITTGRFLRVLSPETLLSLGKVPIGFLTAIQAVRKYKPRVIVSFGGYIGLPVVVAGWIHGIPSVIHEQTFIAGLTNRILSLFCDTVCVSYSGQEKTFFHKNVVYTGLPVRSELFFPPDVPSFAVSGRKPLIYITGGSTGAVSLNEKLFSAIPTLLHTYTIIHQTGGISLKTAKTLHNTLPPSLQKDYIISAYFSVRDVSWIYHKTHMVIGRSGANTVGEIGLLSNVAIFVPLPWSAGHEQELNAMHLVRAGSAVILRQSEITPQKLYTAIEHVETNYSAMKSHAKQYSRSLPRNAADRVAHISLSYVS